MRAFASFAALALVLLSAGACGGDDDAGPAEAPTAAPAATATIGPSGPTVTVRGADGKSAIVTVEIASTSEQRTLGLMHRQQLADDAGMLFLFRGDSTVGFWMKDTLVPLSIAYADAAGRIHEIREGTPQSRTTLTPKLPYRYVLEVNQGWFERHGLGPGATLLLPSNLPPAE